MLRAHPIRPSSSELPAERPERRRCRYLGVALLLLVTLAGAYAGLGRFVLHGPVDGHALRRSLDRAVGPADPSPGVTGACRPARADGRWRCAVWSRELGDHVPYDVRIRTGSSCWDARRVPPFGPSDPGPRPTAAGCVTRW